MGFFRKQYFKVKEDLVYTKIGENGCECYEKSYYPQFKVRVTLFKSEWKNFKDKSGKPLKFGTKDDAYNYLQLSYLQN